MGDMHAEPQSPEPSDVRTEYPDVDALLAHLLPKIQAVLGPRLLGAYLFGSVAAGEYDSDVSDVDVLAVVETALTAAEVAELERVHAAVVGELSAWGDRVETLYVSCEALRTFRERPSPIAVISPGEPLNVKPAGVEWLMNWWDVRERGVVLLGPPASTFIWPILRDEYVGIIRAYAEEFPHRLDESPFAGWLAYVTLTMCRSMYTCAEGVPVSKKGAAEWAANRFPAWAGHIEGALAERMRWREGRFATPMERERTEKFVAFALEVARA